MVPKADGLNLLREKLPGSHDPRRPSGSMPLPIRKRAFWRAAKRGELWLIAPYDTRIDKWLISNKAGFAKIIHSAYCPNNTVYITWPLWV